MTTKIDPNQAMEILVASRPDPETLNTSWYVGRRAQVLEQVLAGSGQDSKPEPGVSPLVRPTNRARRWAIVAAAAAVVTAAGLFGQSVLPSGTPVSLTAAQALDKLADSLPDLRIPKGGYLQESTELASTDADDPSVNSNLRYDTWTAADGWEWSKRYPDEMNELAFYKHAPGAALVDLSNLPSDPAAIRDQLASRLRKNHPKETKWPTSALAMRVIQQALADPRTDRDTRAALIRTLAVLDGVTVTQNATDPKGRPAIEVSLSDPSDYLYLKGGTTYLYFSPTNGALLAHLGSSADKTATQGQIFLSRVVLTALPAEINKVLGPQRKEKWVGPKAAG